MIKVNNLIRAIHVESGTTSREASWGVTGFGPLTLAGVGNSPIRHQMPEGERRRRGSILRWRHFFNTFHAVSVGKVTNS